MEIQEIIAAIKQARFKGLKTILFTGGTGKMKNLADVTIFVPSTILKEYKSLT